MSDKTVKKSSDESHELEELQQKVEEIEQEKEEWKTKCLRALADYQNLEKRTAERIGEARVYAGERIIRDMLDVLDTLEKAQAHLKDPGLGLAMKDFESVLKRNDVQKLETLGNLFDPMSMECIEVEESEEDNIVLSELRSGYIMGEKVIRVAQVKVGKTMPNAK